MRHFHQRLAQQQAHFRLIDVRAAIERLADQRLGIDGRIVGSQRKAEAPLAAGRTVAGALIAALLRERDQRAVLKRNLLRLFVSC